MHLFSILFIFFFKQKTAYEMRISDWSSDVCSSDLNRRNPRQRTLAHPHVKKLRGGVIIKQESQVTPKASPKNLRRATIEKMGRPTGLEPATSGTDRKSVV